MSSAFYDALLIATQSAVEDSWLKTEVRCWDFSAMRLVSFPSCVFAQCMSWNMWKLSVWCWERLFQAVRPHGYYFKLSDRMMIISSCPTAWWLLQAVRPHDDYFKLSDRMMIISGCPTAWYFKLPGRMIIISSCPTALWLFQAVRPHDDYFKLSARLMITSSCPTAWCPIIKTHKSLSSKV